MFSITTIIITNGSSPYTITSSQYSATVPTSLSHKTRPYDFLPVPIRDSNESEWLRNKFRAGHSDFLDPITVHGFQVHSVLFYFRTQCHFALLFHRTGLIVGFLRLNGTNGLWTVPSVSVCCPDIQAYRIRQCSAPLYFATDLTATFCGNIIMRIRLSLTVSVFRRNIAETPKNIHGSIPPYMHSTYTHPKHVD